MEGIGFVQLQGQKAQEYLTTAFHYPEGGYREDRGTLFTEMHGDGASQQAGVA